MEVTAKITLPPFLPRYIKIGPHMAKPNELQRAQHARSLASALNKLAEPGRTASTSRLVQQKHVLIPARSRSTSQVIPIESRLRTQERHPREYGVWNDFAKLY